MSNNKKRFPLFHVPHDGTTFPEELMESVCIPKEQFLSYHERMRDTGVLEMVPTAWRNSGNTLYFPVSRLLCDVERFPGPEEPMERLGMGFCYERAYDGTRIKTVSAKLRRETLVWYHGHHEKLNRACVEHPRFLLLDEITSALDEDTEAQLLTELTGAYPAAVFATHHSALPGRLHSETLHLEGIV